MDYWYEGKRIGSIVDNVFYTKRIERRGQRLRKHDEFGLNAELVDERDDIRKYVITYVTKNSVNKYVIDRDKVLAIGEKHQFYGYEKQYFIPLNSFDIYPKIN